MDIEQTLKRRAQKVMVGGVASGWNDFPIFGANHYSKAERSLVFDVEGKKYIDYCMGWGSLFLGHNPEIIKEAFIKAYEVGFGFQYETEYHVKLAELITEIAPCGEKVRFANSGTEATMFAIRMARCRTGKKKIIKFEGHFHGVHDYLLFAMDACDRLGKKMELGQLEPIPGSAGIPNDVKDLVIPVPYNDTDAFLKVVEHYKDEIAGVIMEPICLASAVIYPNRDFISVVRDVCSKENIVLIFDEVMSGFRENLEGAQKSFNVIPDIATYGKVLGCGLPIAAIAGKTEFMDVLKPIGGAEASGTNTGRVITMIGSYYALSYLKEHEELYERVNKLNTLFVDGVNAVFERNGVVGHAQGYGGRIVIHFGSEKPIRSFRDAVETWNKDYHMACYKKVYKEGLYSFLLPLLVCPEPLTITPVHTESEINETLNILESTVKSIPYK
jgi:glutamate-1-semialdehyde 2,1-aminomutase